MQCIFDVVRKDSKERHNIQKEFYRDNKENITPPLEELGDISGMRISKTTTAKSYKTAMKVK